MERVIVITGASQGIGRAMAELFADRGCLVYDLSRKGQSWGQIRHIPCDLTQPEQIAAAFARIGEEAGRVDVLINNAGFGISGAVEYTGMDDARRLFEVDFFAASLCAQNALPWLRKSARARIINISSVAAIFAIPFQSYYSAAKAALLAWSEALTIELRPMGVQVTAFLPGDVKTGFTAAREKNPEAGGIYGGRIAGSLKVMEKDEQNGMPPHKVARAVYRIASKKRLAPRYTCGWKYRLYLLAGKILPAALAVHVVGLLYDPEK